MANELTAPRESPILGPDGKPIITQVPVCVDRDAPTPILALPISADHASFLAQRMAVLDEMSGLYGVPAGDDESPQTYRRDYLGISRERS